MFFFSSTLIYYCVHLRRKIAGFLFSRQIHLLYYFEKYLHMQSGYKKIHIKISNTHIYPRLWYIHDLCAKVYINDDNYCTGFIWYCCKPSNQLFYTAVCKYTADKRKHNIILPVLLYLLYILWYNVGKEIME